MFPVGDFVPELGVRWFVVVGGGVIALGEGVVVDLAAGLDAAPGTPSYLVRGGLGVVLERHFNHRMER
jgi:hypothetical protein